MLMEKPEDFIFPAPKFSPKMLKYCKEYLIEIPTGRKDEKNNEEKIPCLFKKYPKSKYLLISFHCNGMDMISSFHTMTSIAEKYKMNILVPEYPGYTLYNYPKNSQKCFENSVIIYDFVIKNMKNISEKNIYVFGRSLGTGPAIYLASNRNIGGVFLLSPYTTFAEVAKKHHSIDFYHELTKHLRSIDHIDKIKCPLCIFHGKSDSLIYSSEAEKLFEKCKDNKNKELHLIDDMGHNDIFYFTKKMNKLAKKFIEAYCPMNEPGNNESELDLDQIYYHNFDKKEDLEINDNDDNNDSDDNYDDIL